MAQLPQDRLVRKEVSLGIVREAPQPEAHIGLSLIAPFLPVESDDVIFDYTLGLSTGLAPARAEDAESELAQKDETVGTGRAAIIDWAIKDHYDPSDVSRFREAFLLGLTEGVENFPLTVRSMREGFEQRLARDALLRRRKLDNRIEWLIMTAIDTGAITYNDGKVVFSVDFGRPANQNASVTPWSSTSSDPINATLAVQDFLYDTWGVRTNRALASSKIIRNILNSDKFAVRSGFAGSANSNITPDPRYAIDGWGIQAALDVFQRATGVTLIPYDSVYRTRALGSTTFVNNRFTSENHLIFLPTEEDIAEVSNTQIGFAKTLTSPHPESNWQPGFYEWERETVDPWGQDLGSGVKAFPVFPHMEYTYRLKVL